MRLSLHIATLSLGIFLLCYGGVSLTRPISVWSDWKAFSARVAAEESLRPVLSLGGESEDTDFQYLLDRVWSLSERWKPVIWAGLLVFAVGATGTALEIDRIRKREGHRTST